NRSVRAVKATSDLPWCRPSNRSTRPSPRGPKFVFEESMTSTATDLAATIQSTFADPSQLQRAEAQLAVDAAIEGLDRGETPLAEKVDGAWRVNAWVQQAILLYFRVRQMETLQVGPFEYHDKIPLKRDYASLGVRVVPPAVARYGSYLERGVIL